MTPATSKLAAELLATSVVWDNHACMPLRPGDVDFLPQLERVRKSGIDVISLNVGFDVVDPGVTIHMLATFRHWIRAHDEHYVLADSVASIEAAKARGQLAVVFDIEGGNAVSAHPGLVEIFYRLGVRWMLLAYNHSNALGDGCMDADSGLTAYGRRIIDDMERVGMVLCCSHVGPRTCETLRTICSRPAPVLEVWSTSLASAPSSEPAPTGAAKSAPRPCCDTSITLHA